MSLRTSANRYARALIEVALAEKADLQKVDGDLAGFAALLDSNQELSQALTRAGVPDAARVAVVAAIADQLGATVQVKKLLVLMTKGRRLKLLPDLVEAYRDRVLDHLKIVRGDVTSAVALSPETKQALEASLSQVTGKKVELTMSVDASLLGGVVARIGSTVYDGSVKTQLQKLHEELVASSQSSL